MHKLVVLDTCSTMLVAVAGAVATADLLEIRTTLLSSMT